MEENEQQSIESLAKLLKPWEIDWEPRFREQPWTRKGKLRRTGL